MYTHEKAYREALMPENALQLLKEGNERFINNLAANHDLLQQVNATAAGQQPFAAILSCMDSRTSAELIFDQGLGDIFSLRVAGNVLNEDILGSLEYATQVVGSKLILVLGHTKCVAITGACNQVELGHLSGLLQKIRPAIDAETTVTNERDGNNPEFVEQVTKLHVQLTIAQIMEKSEIISDLIKEGKVKIAGGIYDVKTGKVYFLD
jgi:carbonic anhydrase